MESVTSSREKGTILTDEFTNDDYWRSIILFGLNQATYKIALGKTLLTLASGKQEIISWDDLSAAFLDQYLLRLSVEDPHPQQSNPGRRTVMERVVLQLNQGSITRDKAIDDVGLNAFNDVILRFHTVPNLSELTNLFYDFKFGHSLILKESLFQLVEEKKPIMESELDARWSLLEGAFTISASDYKLGNEILEIYLENGYNRKPLTSNIPFLRGYQGDVCFYCAEVLFEPIHVDHVLPRQVVNHDELWNLVLAHENCNLLKSDFLVGIHFVEKLILRNENIVGSNHPWKQKLISQIGTTKQTRAKTVMEHYNNVKIVLNSNYWNGIENYNPENDAFYRKLITKLNNPN